MNGWTRTGMGALAVLAASLAAGRPAAAQLANVQVSLTLSNQSGAASYVDQPVGRFVWVESGATSRTPPFTSTVTYNLAAGNTAGTMRFIGPSGTYEVHPAGANGNRMSTVQCRITVQGIVNTVTVGTGQLSGGTSRIAQPACRGQSDSPGCSIYDADAAVGSDGVCRLPVTIHPIN